MGVPKFYRWISERYPCLSEVVKEYQLPEFDNLYLDMNGIIHTCSHPDDNNPHFRITEEKILTDVFHYIEVLFRMIKPKKVFFMAVDGVAPRAKMNQQRGRRFRSAREAEELIKQALLKGENLPKEERFDSNCITPGTEFMARLHEGLKYFVAKKISTDRLWQGPRIYLSGHETPGEGEHKIMDFIRTEKSCEDYDPNKRHCLYGLDADLIMLGLTTHDPHFSLLREEVKFSGKSSQQKRSSAPEETTFHLLHLSLMREYLDYEFAQLKTTLPFEYDLERIIDDWVLMGFLVGNDFIPHLPHMHIHQDCLPILWSTYKEVLPKLDGYLNEGGFLNLVRFEKFMSSLSQLDIDNFQEQYADMKWVEGKLKEHMEKRDETNSSQPACYLANSLSSEKVGIPTATKFMENKGDKEDVDGKLIDFETENDLDADVDCEEEDEEEEEDEDSSSSSEGDGFTSEFKKFKANYYIEKMGYKKVTTAVLQSQSHGYVKAIQWILHYYYNGVQSWSWYYSHHYAPYLSDVKNFSDMKMEFEMGKPFLPFQQLMAVLPTASKNLLPVALQSLMVSDMSQVIDYYPINFETDLNGKQQEWEAVVLIPFIDEERLLKAMRPLEEKMNTDEKTRNCHGPHLLYQHTDKSIGIYKSPLPKMFPDILNNLARLTELPKDYFSLPISHLRKGLCKGVKQDLFYPGFPTLKHIPHTASLKKTAVKVFQMNSRNDNMILSITDQPLADLKMIAEELIGSSIFVGWPHLFEAFIVAVADDENKYVLIDGGNSKEMTMSPDATKSLVRCELMSVDAATVWHREMDGLTERYLNRWGIDVGDTQLLVYAKPITGRRYIYSHQGKVTLERQWQTQPEPFLFQATVKDIAVHDESFCQFKTLDQLFPAKRKVFLLGNPHYGCMGEVMDVEMKEDARIRVQFTIPIEPDVADIRRNQDSISMRFVPAYVLAKRLGLSPHLLSRVTGTIYMTEGTSSDEGTKSNRINIGLNLKFNKTNKEVPGYTKKAENDWLYSSKVEDVLAMYTKKFPEVFECICTSNQNNVYCVDDIFKEKKMERVVELTSYLKSLPCTDIVPTSQGTIQLDEFVVKEIENVVTKTMDENKKRKKKPTVMRVRPHLLYQSLEAQSTLIPDSSALYELLDRVINIRDGYSVPLGLRGTIIGIMPAKKEQEVVYEVVFDEPFIDGLTIRCSVNRAYQMPSYAMINISHGERKEMHRVNHPMQTTTQNVRNHGGSSDQQNHWKTNIVYHNSSKQASAYNSNQQNKIQILQKEKPKISSFHQVSNFPVTRPQECEDVSFEKLWNQLKEKPEMLSSDIQSFPFNQPLVSPHFNQLQPPAGCQPLPPPQSWIQESLNQKTKSNESKTDLLKVVPSQNHKDTLISSEHLKRDDLTETFKELKTKSEDEENEEDDYENHFKVESSERIFNSSVNHGGIEGTILKSPSYGLPLKLDDLFKGASERCHLNDEPKILMAAKASDFEQRSDEGHEEKDHHETSTDQLKVAPPMKMSPSVIRPTTLAPFDVDPEASKHSQQHNMAAHHHHHHQQQQQQFRVAGPSHFQQQQQQHLRATCPSLQQQRQFMTSVAQPHQHHHHHQQQQQQFRAVGPYLQQQQQLRVAGPLQPHQLLVAGPHQQTAQLSQPHSKNDVMMLLEFCRSKGMPDPKYEHTSSNDGRHRVVVQLHNGMKFVGSSAKRMEQAMESAAGVALFNLNQHIRQASIRPAMFSVGPEFVTSPNSAFTRVQAIQGNNSQGGFPVQMLPGYNPPVQNIPGYQIRPMPHGASLRIRQPQCMYNIGGQMQFQHTGSNADGQYNAMSNNQSSQKMFGNEQKVFNHNTENAQDVTSCLTNQFIPTQVLRQNKTPQKSLKQHLMEETAAPPPPLLSPNLLLIHSNDPIQQNVTTSEDLHCQETIEAQNESMSTSSGLASTPHRRTKSRIAANFSMH